MICPDCEGEIEDCPGCDNEGEVCDACMRSFFACRCEENRNGAWMTRAMTAEEAAAAYDAAEPVPLSAERIRQIVDYATGRKIGEDETP